MKKFVLISKCFMLLIFMTILFCNIYVILEQLVLRNIAPKFFGYSFAIQNSNSLDSEISSGDLLIIKESNQYQDGDIVTYIKNKDTLVSARIKKIEDNIVTLSILENNAVEITTTGYIVGKVVKNLSGVGSFINWSKNPVGIIVLLLCTIVIFEMPHFICVLISKRKNKTKNIKINAV